MAKRQGTQDGPSKVLTYTLHKSNRGCHEGPGPLITIPMNVEGEMRTLTPSKIIKYLGMWIDSRLTLTEHVRTSANLEGSIEVIEIISILK